MHNIFVRGFLYPSFFRCLYLGLGLGVSIALYQGGLGLVWHVALALIRVYACIIYTYIYA